MKRTVVSFDAPDWLPPPAAVIDTNVIAEALMESEPEHLACAALVNRLIHERSTLIFSRLMEMELWEAVFNIALRASHPRKHVRHMRYDAKGRREAVRLLDEARQAWIGILQVVPWICVELDEVASAVPDLMKNYGFQSYDAVHVGTLLASGASDLITRDKSFAALLSEDATIHTTQARFASTRAWRERAMAQRTSDQRPPV